MNLSQALSSFSSLVWGIPLMVLLVGTGVYLTLRLCFVQLRGFAHGVNVIRGKYDKVFPLLISLFPLSPISFLLSYTHQ